jgi:hypothetical protein
LKGFRRVQASSRLAPLEGVNRRFSSLHAPSSEIPLLIESISFGENSS